MDFEALYQNYAGAVYSYLMFKLQNEQLAEDLLQDTFAAVYQNREQLHQVASPKAWVLAIAHNKLVDHLRRLRPASPLSVEVPASTSLEQESNLLLAEALAQLPDVERTIMYGLYVEGLSYQELAQILELPEGTVKSKAHYARKRLYRWLQEGSPCCII